MHRLALLLVLVLIVSACGGDDTATEPEAAEEPAAVEQPVEAEEPAPPKIAVLTAEGAVEGEFLNINGTANLPNGAMLRSTVTGADGSEETLHLLVTDGAFTDGRYLPGTFPDGPLTVVILFDPALEVYGTEQPPDVAAWEPAEFTFTVEP